MLTVRYDEALEPTVRAIVDRHSPVDPGTRRTEYTREGWERFDPEAKPYRPSDAEIERIRRSNA